MTELPTNVLQLILRIPCRYRSNIPLSKSLEYDDTENWNPEEVHNSLKKTSAEIQSYRCRSHLCFIHSKYNVWKPEPLTSCHYSFNSFDSALKDNQQKTFDRDSVSLDSGISQISVLDGRLDTLDEQGEYPRKLSSPLRRKEGVGLTRKSFSPVQDKVRFSTSCLY